MKKILSLLLLIGHFLWGQNFFEAENYDEYPISGSQQQSVFYEEESGASFFNSWNQNQDAYQDYYDEPDMGLDSGGNPGDPSVPVDGGAGLLIIVGLLTGIVFLYRKRVLS